MTIRNFEQGPERKIQDAIIRKLESQGWFVMETHGNMYQQGFPDLYVCHRRYGARWLEVKNPLSYSFTPAQRRTFPRMHSEGVGIWILGSDKDSEINKLFKPCNWWTYLEACK